MILNAKGQRIKPEIQTGDGRQSQMYKNVQRLDTVKLWANSKPNAEKQIK
jgi:hypothetical protein